jgi:2,3-dihydroxybenzoate-AMP ligase
MYDELIARWATEAPDSPAVIVPNGGFSFATFDRHINNVAARLQTLNLRPGSRVVVVTPDDYAHWLLLLALDRLGMVSVSLGAGQASDAMLAALKADLVVTAPEADLQARVQKFQASHEWFKEALAAAPAARPPRRQQPGEIVRIFSSSGTTGLPKLMAFTRSQVTARIDASRTTYRAGPLSRACALMGPGTSGGYLWSLVFWSSGGSVLLNTRVAQSLGDELRRAVPTHLVVAPGTLLNIMRNPAANLPQMPSLEIHVAGSTLPRVLATEVASRLSPNIVMRYAAAEVGAMAMGAASLLDRHDGTAGYVATSAEVQVVDRDGNLLPPGVTGILRARTAGMFTGYLNDAKATAAVLRDGWFYPGDLGSLSADGLLLVQGRDMEIMNIGGDKYAPNALEEVALSCAGIRDAAAFSVPDGFGIETPWVAVVHGEGHRKGEVLTKLRARWPGLAGVRVAVIATIPRNQMGKVERLTLRRLATNWASARAL